MISSISFSTQPRFAAVRLAQKGEKPKDGELKILVRGGKHVFLSAPEKAEYEKVSMRLGAARARNEATQAIQNELDTLRQRYAKQAKAD